MILRMLCKFYYWLIGWKIGEPIPNGLRKFVAIGAPHTSTWDFPIGIAAVYIYETKIRYLVKKEVFQFPFKWIFSGTGGIAVDRSTRTNTVDQMVEMFDKSDDLILAIAPESTRAKVDYWKTGFYHIAVAAKVPLVLGYLDYDKKRCGFGDVLYPTGDIEADFVKIRDFYSKIRPGNPEKFDLACVRPRKR